MTDRQSTHADGCWSWGQRHYECALREIEALRAERDALLRKAAHPAITHCDNCGCDWLDNGLNPVGCPYCELRREVELPPLPRLQVPRIEADVSLLDIKVLAEWCERIATDYARSAVLADRASREPSPQGDAQPTSATLRCRRCGDTADVSFSYARAALAKESGND